MHQVVDSPGAVELQASPRGYDIELKDVTFGYRPDLPILQVAPLATPPLLAPAPRMHARRKGVNRMRGLHAQGLSLRVPAGTSCAVVGTSGSGKSTLLRLLFRFYEPDGGALTLGGRPLAAYSLRSLRARIGKVPQDMVLFNDTIFYNIAYGQLGASAADVHSAARQAAIHDQARAPWLRAGTREHYDGGVGNTVTGLAPSGSAFAWSFQAALSTAQTTLASYQVLVPSWQRCHC